MIIFPAIVNNPKTMNNQENLFAPANPGSFVNRKNMPKIRMKTESKIPNIIIYFLIFPIPKLPRDDLPFYL